jgi:hypothetical protein
LKMLVVKWVHIPVWISLLVILGCISGSIVYSIYYERGDDEPITRELKDAGEP